MSRVLIIESSARLQDSVSRQLTRDFISQWQAANPADQISVRDLALNPVPHLDSHCLLYTSPSPRDLSTSRMPSSA